MFNQKIVFAMVLVFFCTLLMIVSCQAGTYYLRYDGSASKINATSCSSASTSMSCSTFNSEMFSSGDIAVVCNEVINRCSLNVPSNVTLTSEGEAEKPKIYGSVDKSNSANWTDSGNNIWQCSSLPNEVGNIILNNEELCAIRVKTEAELTSQGKYWYDSTNDLVKFYSSSNPGNYYSHIELAIYSYLIMIQSKNNINVENLDLRYSTGQGINILHGNYINVKKNNVSYIGGAQFDANTRYGNGIQVTGNSTYVYIEKNRVDNILDAGITPQGDAANRNMNHIYVRNNIVTNCEYNIEWWFKQDTSTMSYIYVENNTLYKAGSGWGHNQRWGAGSNGRNLLVYSFTANSSNLYWRNNILSESTETSIRFSRLSDITKFTMDYNDYFKSSGSLAYVADTGTYSTLSDWKTATSQDTNSKDDNPRFLKQTLYDFHLCKNSPCIDAGIDVGLTEDYEGNPIPLCGISDIGAYESTCYVCE